MIDYTARLQNALDRICADVDRKAVQYDRQIMKRHIVRCFAQFLYFRNMLYWNHATHMGAPYEHPDYGYLPYDYINTLINQLINSHEQRKKEVS